jgi:hypothetical protein
MLRLPQWLATRLQTWAEDSLDNCLPEECRNLVRCGDCKWCVDKHDIIIARQNCSWPENVTYALDGHNGCYLSYNLPARDINYDSHCPYWNLSWRKHRRQLRRLANKRRPNS